MKSVIFELKHRLELRIFPSVCDAHRISQERPRVLGRISGIRKGGKTNCCSQTMHAQTRSSSQTTRQIRRYNQTHDQTEGQRNHEKSIRRDTLLSAFSDVCLRFEIYIILFIAHVYIVGYETRRALLALTDDCRACLTCERKKISKAQHDNPTLRSNSAAFVSSFVTLKLASGTMILLINRTMATAARASGKRASQGANSATTS